MNTKTISASISSVKSNRSLEDAWNDLNRLEHTLVSNNGGATLKQPSEPNKLEAGQTWTASFSVDAIGLVTFKVESIHIPDPNSGADQYGERVDTVKNHPVIQSCTVSRRASLTSGGTVELSANIDCEILLEDLSRIERMVFERIPIEQKLKERLRTTLEQVAQG